MSINYWKYCRTQKLKGHYDAQCIPADAGIRIEAGPFSHSFRVVGEAWKQSQLNDFAAYSLAALSMSNGVGFNLLAPVSESVTKQIKALTDIYQFWAIRKTAPLRMEFPLCADAIPTKTQRDGGIICLSGGVDSTYAAISESKRGSVSHGLLIAGADYSHADTQGFKELNTRVGQIADKLDLKLSIIETDIRKHRLNWDMMHGFTLAACLQLMSAKHDHGYIALDYAGYQELFAHPWGNNSILPHYFSTTGFPIAGVGKSKRRVDKLAAIAEFDTSLLSNLSVCFSETSTGGNCGRCVKCVFSRILFTALDLDERSAFLSTPSLEDAVDKMSVPKTYMGLRGRYLRVVETRQSLPKGPLHDKVSNYEEALRRAYIKKRN